MSLYCSTLQAQNTAPPSYANLQASDQFAFFENKGQIVTESGGGTDVKYHTDQTDIRLFLHSGFISYVNYNLKHENSLEDSCTRLDMYFVCDPNSNENITCANLNVSEDIDFHLNYFNSSSTDGITDVQGHHRATYSNAWNDIDFHLTNDGQKPIGQIVAHPGSDPSDIIFGFEGHEQIQIIGLDSILLRLGIRDDEYVFSLGQVYQYDQNNNITPLSWQPRWMKIDQNRIRLDGLGSYDPAQTLVIELGRSPLKTTGSYLGVNWSTYYGEDQHQSNIQICNGNTDEYFYTAMNSACSGTVFPDVSGQKKFNNLDKTDVYITKWINTNKKRKWATYYGKTEDEIVTDMVFDGYTATPRLYIVGNTYSSDLDFDVPTGAFHQGARAAGYVHQSKRTTAGYIASFDPLKGHVKWGTYITGMYPLQNGMNWWDGTAEAYSGKLTVEGIDIDRGYMAVVGSASTVNTTDLLTQSVSNEALPMKKNFSTSYYNDQFVPSQGTNPFLGDAGYIMVFNTANNYDLRHSTLTDFDAADPYPHGLFHTSLTDVVIQKKVEVVDGVNLIVTGRSDCIGPKNPNNYPFLRDYHIGTSPFNEAGFVLELGDNYELVWESYFTGKYGDINTVDYRDDKILLGGTDYNYLCQLSASAPSGSQCHPYYYSSGQYHYTPTAGSTKKIFLAEFDQYRNLIYSCYIGDGSATGKTIAKYDQNGNIYVGNTHLNTTNQTNLYPILAVGNGYNQAQNNGAKDVVFSMLDPNKKMRWSSYFGGDQQSNESGDDVLSDLEPMNTNGKIFLGLTSHSFSTPADCASPAYCDLTLAYDGTSGTQDAFLAELDYWDIIYPSSVRNDDRVQAEINVYPTSTKDKINIELLNISIWTDYTIRVIDILGNIVYQSHHPHATRDVMQIDVEQWSTGSYFIQVSNSKISSYATFTKL